MPATPSSQTQLEKGSNQQEVGSCFLQSLNISSSTSSLCSQLLNICSFLSDISDKIKALQMFPKAGNERHAG